MDYDDPLILKDVAAWRAWLDENEETSDGVWLLVAKKGITEPTSLMVAEALQEALCSGWIDGQRRSRDKTTFLQRYTPRRKASVWSEKNTQFVAALIEQGRTAPAGRQKSTRPRQTAGGTAPTKDRPQPKCPKTCSAPRCAPLSQGRL